MWVRFFNSKWFNPLFGGAIAIISVILAHSLSTQFSNDNSVQQELKNRPTLEYVNQQVQMTNDNLKQHINESAKTDETLMKYIMSIDSKINILLSKQNEK